jgi:hypothetical protein
VPAPFEDIGSRPDGAAESPSPPVESIRPVQPEQEGAVESGRRKSDHSWAQMMMRVFAVDAAM